MRASGVAMGASAQALEARLALAQGDAERLDLLLDLARAQSAAFRNREGLKAAAEALELARRRRNPLAEGQALSVATLCHYQRGDPVAAVATGLDAVEAYADGDVVGRSRAYQSIALALFSVEAFDLAETMGARSVEDARAGQDREREAYACNVYGSILADRGHFNNARRHFRTAIAYYRQAGDPVRMKKATSNLAHTYRKQGNAYDRLGKGPQGRMQWTQALRVYRIALAAPVHDADDAIILGSMAECECRLESLDAALASVTRALALAGKTGTPNVVANCRLWEGHVLRGRGDLDGAQRAYEQACAAAAEVEHDEVLVTCLHALATLLRSLGRDERATQVEERAQRVAVDRAAFLVRVREQLGPLWNRYTGERRK